jgi:hypothetical protein
LDHDIFIKKLDGEIDSSIVEKLDYLTEKKYNYIRKQILDIGNDSYRDIENFALMLEINFSKERRVKEENGKKN